MKEDFYTENEVNKILDNKWPKLDEFYKFMDEKLTQINNPVEPKKSMTSLIKDYCKLINAYDFSIEYDYGFEYTLGQIVITLRFKLPFEEGQDARTFMFRNKKAAIENLKTLIENHKP